MPSLSLPAEVHRSVDTYLRSIDQYALAAFDEHWHPIVDEALRIRVRRGSAAVSAMYDSEPAARLRATIAFAEMVINQGLKLTPVAAENQGFSGTGPTKSGTPSGGGTTLFPCVAAVTELGNSAGQVTALGYPASSCTSQGGPPP